MSNMMAWSKNVNYVYLVVLSGNFLALTGDSAIAWPSPVLAKLNSTENPLDHPVDEEQLSWVASISGFGSIVGILPFCFLPDLIGRKASLLIISVPHMISFLLSAFAKTIELIYVARFFSGFSIASCYMVLPMYVAEISENSNRGLMLVSYAIFSNFGSLLSYIVGPLVSMFWFNIILLIFPVCFFITFLFAAPESPYYYVIKKDHLKAYKSVEWLRRNNSYKNFEMEVQSIEAELENAEKGKIWETLKKKYAIKGTIIVFMLTSFQQLTGYAVFVPYAQQIFQQAGSNLDSAVCSMIVGSVAFFSSFLCPFIIDRQGRRFVLIVSTTGIIISELLFGTYYYLSSKNYNLESVNWMPLICLISFMLFYTFGLGPLPLTVTSEILPVNIKFFITSIAGLLGTASSTIMSKNYYYFNHTLGYFGTIWLFAGLCTVLLIFIVCFLPETKGKSFSEILEKLDR